MQRAVVAPRMAARQPTSFFVGVSLCAALSRNSILATRSVARVHGSLLGDPETGVIGYGSRNQSPLPRELLKRWTTSFMSRRSQCSADSEQSPAVYSAMTYRQNAPAG